MVASPSSANVGAALPPGFLDGFSSRSLPRNFLLSAPGQVLNQVIIVRSGRLRVYLASETRELSLSFLEPGDLFSTHGPTYVSSVEATELWVIDAREFARKLAEQPAVIPLLMRVLGRILKNSVSLLEDLAFRDVPARFARFLILQAEQRGVPTEGGTLLPLNLGTEDIACLLGTTRQSVSSLINQWQRDGLLTRHGRGKLMILDLPGLLARSLNSA